MVLACVLGLFAGIAMAAESESYPKTEFFGGYQYSRLEGGVNANGFAFALNGNFNNYSESPLISGPLSRHRAV